ncbi:hypothetical protein [Listeria welshimeri]|uniref:hypothetical protein n=1 Tax=Listeria welshimeri TaxID=1643 RepID=UPI0016246C89|nr:hypothetical protein [Listeria welshimeri]MBC1445481.1 hypothetical protein [Listeria welshimeri]MBC2008894.1 hypothetical protein [Listeria welshimeri]MBF2456588.1 hypothetical protein [Listeria welshimeri]MBF2565944.1 hypothetical protein [Listeria welshimeri]
MSEFNLLDCIGKAINTVEIQKLLNITNIDENNLNGSLDSFTTYGISGKVELHFQKAIIIQVYLEDENKEIQETFKELLNQMLTAPKDMLFLNAVVISNNSLFDLGYHLPTSMEINKTTKAELIDRLGEPYLINNLFNSVGWRINGNSLAGGFDENNDILTDVTVAIF